MPSRAFTARDTENDPDPISFVWSGREFRCVPMAPVAALDIISNLPTLPASDDPRYRVAVVEWCTRAALFVRYCLRPSSVAEWESVTREEYAEPDQYAELVTWLATVYRERLSPEPAPTSGGPSEGHSAPDPGDLDPITARQIEIDRAAGIEYVEPSPYPDHLQALLDAGGGFSPPGT